MVILFWLITVTLLVAVIAMLIVIGKKGDERRRFIVEKASSRTFYVAIGILLLDSITASIKGKAAEESSLIMLAVLALVFLIELLHLSRIYGE
jgi:uncharacterized membrane protein